MNTELFISEIMQRPAIWMSRLPQHKMRNVIKRLWIEIKQSFPGQEIDELKRKWKNLKDNYRKELKKYPVSRSGDPLSDFMSQWKYFELLDFLKDELMPTEGDKNMALEPQIKEENETIHLSEEESTEPQSLADPISPSSPQTSTSTSTQSSETTYLETKTPNRNRKRRAQLRAEYLEIEKKKLKLLELEVAKSTTNNEEKKSDDYYFLMSLLPQMEKLNVMQKMRLRNKFNQALMDEIALNENHYRY